MELPVLQFRSLALRGEIEVYLAVSVLEFMQGTQLYIIAVFVISNIEHITLF